MKNKLKISFIVIILTISVFILSGCQNDNNDTNNTNSAGNTNTLNTTADGTIKYTKEEDSSYKTYTGKDGVSFMYPLNWVSVGTDDDPVFMSPDAKGASVNVAVDTIQKEGSPVTEFDEYIGLQKLYLTQQMTMLTDIKQTKVELNGRNAYILNYETENEQDNKKVNLNITQVAFEDNGNVYILTMVVLNDYYNSLQSTFDKITKSFTK